MPDFEFSDLQDLVNALYDPYYLPSNGKIKLAELLKDVMELEGKKSPKDAIAALKSKMKNELKREVSDKMKQKIGKLEQLETENKDLQTKKDNAEWLNKAFKYAKNTAQKENIELKNKLNTQICQLQEEKKILEAQNKTIEQLEERVIRIATASTGLAVGLAIYISLEHATKLDMWLMVSIAVVPALIATGIALKPSAQLNKAQELRRVANESSVT